MIISLISIASKHLSKDRNTLCKRCVRFQQCDLYVLDSVFSSRKR